MKPWQEALIFIAVVLVVSGIVAGIILSEPKAATPSPSVSPITTVTFIPPLINENVNITTVLPNATIVCIGFDSLFTLEYGNCGDPSIQGSWMYNVALQVAINSIVSTSKTNCLINPTSIINPTIFGQPTSGSLSVCQGIQLNNNFISGFTSDGTIVRIGFIGNNLAWVTDIAHAQPFNIVVT
jgi:hypothetical protein